MVEKEFRLRIIGAVSGSLNAWYNCSSIRTILIKYTTPTNAIYLRAYSARRILFCRKVYLLACESVFKIGLSPDTNLESLSKVSAGASVVFH